MAAKTAKAAARAVLAGEPARSRPKSQVQAWFEKHAGALEFVDTWLGMRAKGETRWGFPSVAIHLRKSHRFPFKSDTTLLNWLRKYRDDAYEKALAS